MRPTNAVHLPRIPMQTMQHPQSTQPTTIKSLREEITMRLHIFAIYDSAAGAYMRPFFTRSDPEALREFGNLCNNADHPIGAHPEDYSLCRIGSWDDVSGHINGEKPVTLRTALEAYAQSREIDPKQLLMLDQNLPEA